MTGIDLRGNWFGYEGAKAWCLGRRVFGSRFCHGEIKLEPSGVPEVFETCETLVALVDWGSGVRLFDFFGSFQKSCQTGWKYGSKMKVGQKEEFLQLVPKPREGYLTNTRSWFSDEVHLDFLIFPQNLCFSCLLISTAW